MYDDENIFKRKLGLFTFSKVVKTFTKRQVTKKASVEYVLSTLLYENIQIWNVL